MKSARNKKRITSLLADNNELWFAAYPFGTEDIYKIYAESFRAGDHLRRILDEAQTIVSDTLETSPQN
jgi:phosphoglucomutase